jgi:HD superfamily phosphohydrolase YqeK
MSDRALLHPIIEAAADGRLPDWARAGTMRREHMERVATLMGAWALQLGLDEQEQRRWRSLGYLHDALKEAAEEALRPWVEPPLDRFPAALLHGPAAAARLESAGVDDQEVLDAVRYHTVGHADLSRIGRALYAADFIEPGRESRREWQRRLVPRLPQQLDECVKDIVKGRIQVLLERSREIPVETAGFWNKLASEVTWVRAPGR